MTPPRMTIPTQRVLRVLLGDVGAEFYGIEIGESAELPSGTIHPILARLGGGGGVESGGEEFDPRPGGRPARRYYRLTATGAEEARHALARAYRPARPRMSPLPLPEES